MANNSYEQKEMELRYTKFSDDLNAIIKDKEDMDVYSAFFHYTLSKLSLDDTLEDILESNNIEFDEFSDTLEHACAMTIGWHKEFYPSNKDSVRDLFFDAIEPVFNALKDAGHEWTKETDEETERIIYTFIANILRLSVEECKTEDVASWMEAGIDFGYDIKKPIDTYAALREHYGLPVSDPELIYELTKNRPDDTDDDNHERDMAELIKSFHIPSEGAARFIQGGNVDPVIFYKEHSNLCDMLFASGAIGITRVPKVVDVGNVMEDNNNWSDFMNLLFDIQVGEDLQESMKSSGNEELCRSWFEFGLKIVCYAIKEGKTFMGIEQGVVFDATLDNYLGIQ